MTRSRRRRSRPRPRRVEGPPPTTSLSQASWSTGPPTLLRPPRPPAITVHTAAPVRVVETLRWSLLGLEQHISRSGRLRWLLSWLVVVLGLGSIVLLALRWMVAVAQPVAAAAVIILQDLLETLILLMIIVLLLHCLRGLLRLLVR